MIKVRALKSQPKAAEILIYDFIGEDWYGDGCSAKKIDTDLKAIGEVEDITVRINSPGGSVFDGIAIYNMLKNHGANINVVIEGIAASAASIIAMAGTKITMGTATQIMIHNPWTMAVGDAGDFRKTAETLDQIRDGMIDAYHERTGLDRKTLLTLCNDETWMGPTEAISKGFADSLVEQKSTASARTSKATAAAFAMFKHVPAGVFNMPTDSAAAFQAAEAERRREVRAMFSPFASAHRELLDQVLDDPQCSAEKASTKLLAALAEGAEPLRPIGVAGIGRDAAFKAAAVDGLLLRAGIPVANAAPGASDLQYTTVLDLARTCLSQADRGTAKFGTPGALIRAALSTSDFPGILESAMGKSLRAGFEADPQSHAVWVRRTQVPDFKIQSRVLLGSAPSLQKVAEGGEYKFGALGENKATLMLEKFGRLIELTWELLINDDLGAFVSVPNSMGSAARRAEADSVYSLFTANSGAGVVMQDTVNLFHATHLNVATAGALSITTLGAARGLLRKQQALGNGGYMNLAPRFLIVPVELESAAEQLIAQSTRHLTASTETAAPAWVSQLQLVVEPRLPAANGFYLAAHWSQIDTVELATLAADGGVPVLFEEDGFTRDSRTYKVRFVFDAAAVDWKGLVRVPAS